MSMSIETGGDGTLIVRQPVGLWTFLIGLPILGLGGLFGYGTVSSFVITIQEQGWDGLPQAVVGSFVMALFAALSLPLGWWIALSRHWIVLDRNTRQIVQVSDWRIGSQKKATDTSLFRCVRAATEALNTSTNSQGKGPPTLVEMIQLIPCDPDATPKLDLGWTSRGDQTTALELATEVADWLSLPLENGFGRED